MAKSDKPDVLDEPLPLVGASPPLSLEELRERFFAQGKESKAPLDLEWNGISWEWRIPSIQQVQDAQKTEDQNFMVSLIIGYSYMPGTENKLFTEDDYEALVQMPLSGEFQAIVKKISDALKLNVEEKVKN